MRATARPTWAPTKEGDEQGGAIIFGPSQKYSSRDLAAHTTLKPRREGQDTHEELQKRNLREELEECERRHFSSKDKSSSESRDRRRGSQLLLEGLKRDVEDRIVQRNQDADDSDVEAKSDEESMPEDEGQLCAAHELMDRGWLYHRDLTVCLRRLEILATHQTYERGSFICFDPNAWETIVKERYLGATLKFSFYFYLFQHVMTSSTTTCVFRRISSYSTMLLRTSHSCSIYNISRM